MANRISTIFDADDRGFKSALKGISTSVGQAEGMLGKFKAGGSAAFDAVKQNAGTFAVAAGTALVAFGIKAVGAFTDVAKAAIDLSTATGLGVEDASRWLGVADDYKVSAEAMATGLGKIAKTLDDTKWSKYGIETRDAGGHARDVNDILLDTFDMLSKVDNKTEQAVIGQKLFGKGYQSLTPILGHTREEYEKMLGAVEKGQVITAKEAEKAEKFRLAQDALDDAIKEVTLSVGQAVAELAPFVEATANAVTEVVDFAEAAIDATEKIGGLKGALDILANTNPVAIFDHMVDAFSTFTPDVEDATEAFEHFGIAGNATQAALDKDASSFEHMGIAGQDAGIAIRNANTAMAEAAREAGKAQRATDNLKASWDLLKGTLSDQQAWIDVENSFADVKQAGIDAMDAAKKHTADAEQKTRDYESALLDLRGKVIDYAKDVGGLPLDVTTMIQAQVDNGSIANANELLDAIAHARQVIYNAQVAGHREYEHNAMGTSNAADAFIAGERGPELVIGHGGSTVVPAAQTAAMLNGNGGGVNIENLTIVMPPGSDGNDVVRQLKKYESRNGPGWRS